MNFAVIGCGFISDSYLARLDQHTDLSCVGVFDRLEDRAGRLAEKFGLRKFDSMQELLDESAIDFVLNLTNPREHFTVTRGCLLAGKHVYSEKPLGMDLSESKELLELSNERGLGIAVAPCSVLSPSAQLLWKQVKSGCLGTVRLIYANFDDGFIAPHEQPWNWKNSIGVNWPAKDEFEVGCTFEHAGYFLTWLCSMFGPATRVSAFASTLVQDKGIEVDSMAPDFTCGCIEFGEGIVARATCGLVAPRDKSLVIIGDDGYLIVENLRDDYGDVIFYPRREPLGHKRIQNLSRRFRNWIPQAIYRKLSTPYNEVFKVDSRQPKLSRSADKRVDFLRGPSEFASAIREGRENRLSGEMGAHIVEILNCLHATDGQSQKLTTTFKPPLPLLFNDA